MRDHREEKQEIKTSEEQIRYASILEKGMLLGLITLFITFAIYVFRIINPYIPFEQLPHYWKMRAHEYLSHANIEPGWHWIRMLKYSDFLNFIGIALLSGMTIICYISIIPILIKKKDYIFTLLSIIEVLILLLAASGILTIGH